MPLLPSIYLSISLFSIGLVIVIVKQNAIMVLMGIELMLNAANINLVTFNQNTMNSQQGEFFAIFIIVVAVCEAAVGLAIIYKVYKYYNTSITDQVSELKG
ncbi:MAG: NADH-quinone oxidoreductase subunit NuoK [Flammeovirgaceae bacterium]|nr:NADH-quinone oxidoreductase subunit NuoK [Flammeovirgaceae bacterium]